MEVVRPPHLHPNLDVLVWVTPMSPEAKRFRAYLQKKIDNKTPLGELLVQIENRAKTRLEGKDDPKDPGFLLRAFHEEKEPYMKGIYALYLYGDFNY